MAIQVRNNTQKVMGYGGARIPPGGTGECDKKASDAKKHVFFKTGQLSIVGGSVAKAQPTNPAQTGGSGDESGEGSGEEGGGDQS